MFTVEEAANALKFIGSSSPFLGYNELKEGSEVKTVQDVREQYVKDGNYQALCEGLEKALRFYGFHEEDMIWRRTEEEMKKYREKQDMCSPTNWILRTPIMK